MLEPVGFTRESAARFHVKDATPPFNQLLVPVVKRV